MNENVKLNNTKIEEIPSNRVIQLLKVCDLELNHLLLTIPSKQHKVSISYCLIVFQKCCKKRKMIKHHLRTY